MSNKYIVDSEIVKDAITNMKELKNTCDEHAKKKVKMVSKGKGKTNNEISAISKNVIDGWSKLSVLCEKTVKFLSDETETVDNADKQAASAVRK